MGWDTSGTRKARTSLRERGRMEEGLAKMRIAVVSVVALACVVS